MPYGQPHTRLEEGVGKQKWLQRPLATRLQRLLNASTESPYGHPSVVLTRGTALLPSVKPLMMTAGRYQSDQNKKLWINVRGDAQENRSV
ncbi:hypothetical protein EYF80_024447 [Liparis tanakae]|uniref:Uncharacterized protein n=1 Tax=Liparis tanakae TaxID=230148 RepID=A0A4Z2HK39_9TELE|nr:hypothetical protein EYF80_024447 [Liparis tanakae]